MALTKEAQASSITVNREMGFHKNAYPSPYVLMMFSIAIPATRSGFFPIILFLG
jgi:hypothetical protein